MAHIVVAPDSFKGSIDAAPAAAAIAQGWLTERPGDTVTTLPQADGGEGTLAAIEAAVPGALRHGPVQVHGPDGTPVDAFWLELPDGTAVVELATAAGLPLMTTPDALGASTQGLGELVGYVLDARPNRLLIGLGGSATTDGAASAFRALGLAAHVDNAADDWRDAMTGVDLSALREPPAGGVELLTDVDAPLLGPRGAAHVFAPQKGADAAQVQELELRLGRWVTALEAAGAPHVADLPGAGAAGGAGYGFMALWGARATPGAARIARLTGLDTAMGTADVLITGEGRFDATSLTGKVVGHGLELARAAHVPATIIAGAFAPGSLNSVALPNESPVAAISLTQLAGSTESALAQPREWLVTAGARAAKDFSSA